MTVQKFTLKEHFHELKTRLIFLMIIFAINFVACYYYSDYIYDLLLQPLLNVSAEHNRRIIYTGLTEVFLSYIKLAAFSSFYIMIPFLAIQIYKFISPALSNYEKKLSAMILLTSPVLFWGGAFFVFYYIMPRAWAFFVSFEHLNTAIPVVLEAKVNEYLNLIIDLVLAFSIAFQLPIIILILNLLKIINVQMLIRKRRLSIVINFIIAGIITPPDVLSQIALALPMVLLYELSIIMCKFIDNRENGEC